MSTRPHSRIPQIACWLALAALQIALAALYLNNRAPATDAAVTGFPLDDAWIHLVYADAVARRGWPCYNEGEPEAGFTSPLWMLLSAAAIRAGESLGGSTVAAIKTLGVLTGVLMTTGAFELARRLASGSILAGLIAALLTAAAPPLAFSQIAGMEVCLAAGAALWALVALDRRRFALAGAWLAAAIWSRPELLTLHAALVVLLIAGLGEAQRPRRLPIKAWVLLFLPSAIAIALWATFCLSVSGMPLPNTFYAKFNPTRYDGAWTLLRETLWTLPAIYTGGFLLLIAGWRTLWREASPAARLTLVAPVVFLVGLALTRPFPEGSGRFYYWLRYAAPAFPLLFVPIGVAVAEFWRYGWKSREKSDDSRAEISPVRLARGLVVAYVVAVSIVSAFELRRSADSYAWNSQNINEVQVELGRWIAAKLPESATLVLHDAGALRYFGRRRTIDFLGLNFHPLAVDGSRRHDVCSSLPAMRSFMIEQKAAYLVAFPKTFVGVLGRPGSSSVFAELMRARSPQHTVAPGDEQDTMAIYQLR